MQATLAPAPAEITDLTTRRARQESLLMVARLFRFSLNRTPLEVLSANPESEILREVADVMATLAPPS